MTALPNSSNINTYGAQTKINYQNLPPADPTTDWDNTLLAPGLCDVANMTLTSPRFQISLTLAASTGALVINNWFSVWQNATNTAPIIAQTSTGIFTITLPLSVSDQYTQSIGQPSAIPVNLTQAISSFAGNGFFGFCNISCATNVLTLYIADHTASASNAVGTVCNIWAR
jgi:hypothetical protein